MNNVFKSTTMAVMLTFSIAMPVQAAEPTDASLIKLMQVTKASEQMKQMVAPDNSMMEQMVQGALDSISQDDISDDQRNELGKIINKYNQKIYNQAYIDKLTQQMTDIYVQTAKKHFTQAEVDAQIEFYSSEVGQSIIAKQPAMMQDYMSEVMPIAMQSTMTQLQEIMPQMQAEIAELGLDE